MFLTRFTICLFPSITLCTSGSGLRFFIFLSCQGSLSIFELTGASFTWPAPKHVFRSLFLLEFTKIRELRQVPIDTSETKIGKEPFDNNDKNALPHKIITNDMHENKNDEINHSGIVKKAFQ